MKQLDEYLDIIERKLRKIPFYSVDEDVDEVK